ncbi:tellurite resistance protein [Nitrobacteraceae bacterium AZCC 1564]
MRIDISKFSATMFGMVLGIGGLGSGWRVAAHIWNAPAVIGEILALTAASIWSAWFILYALKWIHAPDAALAEIKHPIQSFFIVLVPMTTMITSWSIAPYLPAISFVLFIAGMAGQLAFTVWGVGGLWMGGRAAETTTPVLYMPTVGGSFVSAIACGLFGYPEPGLLFFGVGFFSIIIMESVILHRLFAYGIPVALRATMGIHLAPPAVACVAYLAVTDGPPDRLAFMLFGYALFQAMVMVRLIPWLREQPFSLSAWAYSFGVSALPLAALRFIERGHTGIVAKLALPIFVVSNLIIGWFVIRSLVVAKRYLLPAATNPVSNTLS